MRVLICGDRYWKDEDLIRSFMTNFPKDTVFIEGNAKGADKIVGKLAVELGFPKPLVYDAHWDEYGYSAGPIRNKKMLDDGKPDFVIGFHDNLDKSKGTANMLSLAKKYGFPNYLIIHNTSAEEFNSIVRSILS